MNDLIFQEVKDVWAGVTKFMEFFNSLQQVKFNWQPYIKWEEKQNDKEFQRQELYKKIPVSKEELEKASQYGRTLVDSINTMDQYSINKAEDVETVSKVGMSFIEGIVTVAEMGVFALAYMLIPSVKKYIDSSKNNSKAGLIMPLVALAPPLLAMPFITVKFASYEKEASRIARYQAREKELKDPKNFVIYDEEQINDAKEIAKTLPDPVEKKKNDYNLFANYGESTKSLKALQKEHKNYLNWKKESLLKEREKKASLGSINPSIEQVQKAKKNQDNLLRTIRKIEINSQNYLANVEMACNIVLGSAIALGAAGGGIIKGAIKLLQKYKVIPNTSKIINATEKYAPIAAPLILILLTASYETKIQKNAARVGRFKAKQELLSDSHNFITYNDEQMNSVKDIKAPVKKQKSSFNKLKDNIKFFMNLKKDYDEYEKYQKTQGKEEQKLQEALKKINISDHQIKEAKDLQKNAFMAFEKMDEMTQRYVDDTEAATDIIKQYVNQGILLAGAALTGYLLSKSKSPKSQAQDNLYVKQLAPVLGSVLVQIPIEIKSTQIEKQAGRIGTMKAMQDLEDPRYFVNN